MTNKRHGLAGRPSNRFGGDPARRPPPSEKITLRLPAGVRAALQVQADAKGLSLNRLVSDMLLLAALGQ